MPSSTREDLKGFTVKLSVPTEVACLPSEAIYSEMFTVDEAGYGQKQL